MIRPYRPSDIDRVLEIWLRASRVAHPFLSEAFLSAERAKIRDVHIASAEMWVWDADGEVEGFIALLGNEVGGLFVDPARHGCGIGRALMDLAIEKHEVLELDVFEANALGRRFYERYGFVRIGRHPDEASGFPALRLRYGG